MVLIVDDDPITHNLITLGSDYLFDFHHVYNGVKAVEIVDMHEFVLIFMDERMPEMTGNEATSLIKEKYPNTPIISVSAFDLEYLENKQYDDYLQKPIIPSNLNKMIEKHISIEFLIENKL